MVSVLCVETSAVNQIDAAADNVAGGESGTVGLSVARRAERISVIAVIAERLFVPTFEQRHENRFPIDF